jgi:hypothetical protein
LVHSRDRPRGHRATSRHIFSTGAKIIEREDIASSGNARSAQPREDETYVDFVS